MPETLTERLGLIKPNRDTNTPLDIERLNLNMDVLDRAVGTSQVADGVIPPSVELYDGKLIVEKGSGKAWVAEKQSNGSFAKKWVKYPYLFTGYTSSFAFGNNTEGLFGWLSYASDPGRYNLNASPNDLVNTFWVCPQRGVWNLDIKMLYQGGAGWTAGFAQSRIAINGSTTDPNAGRSEDVNSLSIAMPVPGWGHCTTESQIQTVLGQGETVLSRLFINTNLPYVTTTGIFKATMIHPF